MVLEELFACMWRHNLHFRYWYISIPISLLSFIAHIKQKRPRKICSTHFGDGSLTESPSVHISYTTKRHVNHFWEGGNQKGTFAFPFIAAILLFFFRLPLSHFRLMAVDEFIPIIVIVGKSHFSSISIANLTAAFSTPYFDGSSVLVLDIDGRRANTAYWILIQITSHLYCTRFTHILHVPSSSSPLNILASIYWCETTMLSCIRVCFKLYVCDLPG